MLLTIHGTEWPILCLYRLAGNLARGGAASHTGCCAFYLWGLGCWLPDGPDSATLQFNNLLKSL